MKTRRTLATLVVAVLLGGCGDDAAIKNTVKEQLKDPGSAQFKEVITSQSGQFACVVWNAKNGLGGYDDWKAATLKKGRYNSSWEIKNLYGAAFKCKKSDLDELTKGAELDVKVGAMLTRLILEGESKASKIAATKGGTSDGAFNIYKSSACGPEYSDIFKKLSDAGDAIEKGSLDTARVIVESVSQRVESFEKAICLN